MIEAYWAIEDDPAKSALSQLEAKHKERQKAIVAWARRNGGAANGRRTLVRDGQIVGVQMKKTLLEKLREAEKANRRTAVWREHKDWPGYFYPSGSNKEGKKLRWQMADLARTTAGDIANVFLGRPFILGMNNGRTFMYGATLERLGGVDIVCSHDHDPGEKGGDQWKPINGLRRMKLSEYHLLREQEAQ